MSKSGIIQDNKQPGFEVARSLAQAFGMSEILLFEMAGLIPALVESSSSFIDSPIWTSEMSQLTTEEAKKVLEFAQFIKAQRKPAK